MRRDPVASSCSLLGLLLIASGCSIKHRPKLQFAGTLTSTTSTCPKTQSTLIVQDGEVVFTPEDGTWVLRGKAVGNAVEATRTRPSFDHKVYATALKATMTDDRVIGTYTTPACTYTVDLARF